MKKLKNGAVILHEEEGLVLAMREHSLHPFVVWRRDVADPESVSYGTYHKNALAGVIKFIERLGRDDTPHPHVLDAVGKFIERLHPQTPIGFSMWRRLGPEEVEMMKKWAHEEWDGGPVNDSWHPAVRREIGMIMLETADLLREGKEIIAKAVAQLRSLEEEDDG